MAGAGIRIDVNVDDREVQSVLRRLGRAMGDMRPALDEFGAEMELDMQHAFLREQSPDGKPWPRSLRARAVAAGRRDATGTAKTGRDTDQLYGSLTHNAGRDHVEWGAGAGHAAYFHFGARVPAHRITPRRASALRFFAGGKPRFARAVNHPGAVIPPRPIIAFGPPQRRVFRSVMAKWLRRAVRRGAV